jgi:hypothetical protein
MRKARGWLSLGRSEMREIGDEWIAFEKKGNFVAVAIAESSSMRKKVSEF